MLVEIFFLIFHYRTEKNATEWSKERITEHLLSINVKNETGILLILQLKLLTNVWSTINAVIDKVTAAPHYYCKSLNWPPSN